MSPISLLPTTGNVTNVLASQVGSPGAFTIASPQEINVAGVITATNGIVALSESGTVSPIAINIGVPINVGTADGTISLTTTGTGSITDAKPIVANNINITASGFVGSSAKPFLTDTLTKITIVGTTASPIFIKDSALGTAEFTGSNVVGGSVSLTTAAQNATIDSLLFGNVTVLSTYANAKVAGVLTIGNKSADQIGDGNGAILITSAAAEIDPGASIAGILGTSVSLISTASNVGGTGPMSISAPSLTLSAAKGSVSVTDSLPVTLSKGAALSSYDVFTNDDIVVAGAISAGSVNLNTFSGAITLNASVGSAKATSITMQAASGIVEAAKAVVSGLIVSLSNSNTANIGTSAQPVVINAVNSFSVTAAASSTNFVTETGKGSLGISISATSTLTLVDTNALNVTDTLNYNVINIVAPSLSLAASTGLISAKALVATAPVVTVPTGASISVLDTASFVSGGALSISGAGTITTSAANAVLILGTSKGKPTTSITLGTRKNWCGKPTVGSVCSYVKSGKP